MNSAIGLYSAEQQDEQRERWVCMCMCVFVQDTLKPSTYTQQK